MFCLKLPASYFYVRHVKGLLLSDVTMHYKEQDVRPAFYLDDVKGTRFRNVLVDDKKLV